MYWWYSSILIHLENIHTPHSGGSFIHTQHDIIKFYICWLESDFAPVEITKPSLCRHRFISSMYFFDAFFRRAVTRSVLSILQSYVRLFMYKRVLRRVCLWVTPTASISYQSKNNCLVGLAADIAFCTIFYITFFCRFSCTTLQQHICRYTGKHFCRFSIQKT